MCCVSNENDPKLARHPPVRPNPIRLGQRQKIKQKSNKDQSWLEWDMQKSLGARLIVYWCSIGSSGRSSSVSPSTRKNSRGGWTMPLNKNVEYTNSANPTICSHLNDSHLRPRDTTQIKSVLQVSMVDREVALTMRVTDNPKKLKPLKR